ncbi:2-hydroxy-3-keto-5-methylthiopentenyl-1-phosphate phosphatase [Neobacillus sp. SM06]|uniref:2-hydroxy-3-keto-5-methylthiopentenyl-1- phosphate phosphatase n=1 Tax=Neobacillus sp. SM06 TaxID=3422492 RepID=UPI003D2DDEDF
MTKNVIFCDFDGTITNNDNIIAIMKKFAPPEWLALKDGVLSQQISVQEGVGKMFALLPSSLKEEIIRFLKETASIRSGFQEFVRYAEGNGYELFIVSGGIDFFVYPLLEGLVPPERIYCNGADFSGETIKILWPHECDEQCDNGCGCCKPSLLRKLTSKEDYKLVIGDSVTDLAISQLADQVIARDFLLEKCRELGFPHKEFVTFHDVMEFLEKKAEVGI